MRASVVCIWLKYRITPAVEVKGLHAVPRESLHKKGHLYSVSVLILCY